MPDQVAGTSESFIMICAVQDSLDSSMDAFQLRLLIRKGIDDRAKFYQQKDHVSTIWFISRGIYKNSKVNAWNFTRNLRKPRGTVSGNEGIQEMEYSKPEHYRSRKPYLSALFLPVHLFVSFFCEDYLLMHNKCSTWSKTCLGKMTHASCLSFVGYTNPSKMRKGILVCHSHTLSSWGKLC